MSHSRHCSPCANQPTPTDCEPLPSALDNFITAIFGIVLKTVNEDGTVSWTLPCNLDEGLPDNPRLEGEGVSCYLLRLINEGITGLHGEQGDRGYQGEQGEPGLPSYAFTTAGFTEPSIGAQIAITIDQDSAWPAVGVTLFIDTSGYYTVISKVGPTLTLQFIGSIAGPGGTIPTGTLVQATGPAGQRGLTGDDGPRGYPGADGYDGDTGPTGDRTVLIFQRSVSQPATPTGDNVPSGWFSAPPAAATTLWLSLAEQTPDGVTVGTWTTPIQLTNNVGAVTTASNVGEGANSYKERVADDLRFRSIVAGGIIEVNQSTDEIEISAFDLDEDDRVTASNAGGFRVLHKFRTEAGQDVHADTESSDATVTEDDYWVSYTGSGGDTFTLPAASSHEGQSYEFKNKSAGTLILDATALGQIFDVTAVNTMTLAAGEWVRLVSDGINWCAARSAV